MARGGIRQGAGRKIGQRAPRVKLAVPITHPHLEALERLALAAGVKATEVAARILADHIANQSQLDEAAQ